MRDWCFTYQRMRHLERFVQGFGYSNVSGYASGYGSFFSSVYGFKGTHYGPDRGVTFLTLKFNLLRYTRNNLHCRRALRLPERPYGVMPSYAQADGLGDFAKLSKTYPLLMVYDNLSYPMEVTKDDVDRLSIV